MRYILIFILLLATSLALNAQTVTFQNIVTPTQYGYLKADSALFIPKGDTNRLRSPTTAAQIRYKTSNNTFYGYYLNCNCWRPLATDSSGIIAQLNLKVDSVTVSGDSLWYWVHGVSHGYILPSAGWKTTANTLTGAEKFGSLNAQDVNIYTNGVARGTFEKRGNFGWGTMFPDKIAEFTSTTSGVLFPRMTTTQRNAIGSPIAGEWLYNSTTSQWNYYNGAAWIALEPPGSDTWDDVLTNGAALLVDHAATNDGHTFSITGDNSGYRQVIRQGSDNISGIYLKNTSNGAIADMQVQASDSSVSLRSVAGHIKLKQLTAGAATDSILSHNSITNDVHYVSRSSLFNSAPWLTEGNGGTDTSLNFIGTTDDVPLIVRVGGNKVGYLGNNDHNIIMGLETMQPLSGADENNVMGWGALQAGVSSFQNVAIGTEALKNTVDGGKSVAIGYHALRSNVSGSGSVGIGAYAGAYLIDPANTIVFNTLDQGNAHGDSLKSLVFGAQDATPANSQIWLNGKLYGRYITGGSSTDSIVTWSKSDSQFHKRAMASIVSGNTLQQVVDNGNTSTTDIVLQTNADLQLADKLILPNLQFNGTTSHYFQLANGKRIFSIVGDSTYKSLLGTISGTNYFWGQDAGSVAANGGGNNIGVGDSALNSLTNGYANIALGFKAARLSASTNYCIAIGEQALQKNTASGIVGVGFNALGVNTTGTFNTAVGNSAMAGNATGSFNTAVGSDAQRGTTGNGSWNVSVGGATLRFMTTADANTAIGYHAGHSTTTGRVNFFGGDITGESNTTGSANTFVGHMAGYNNTTASYNTFVGDSTGIGITTGSNNTIIGARVSGLSSSLANNIIIADGAGNIKAQHDGTNWTLTGGTLLGTGSTTISPLHFTNGAPTTSLAAGNLMFNTGLLILDSTASHRDTLATRNYIRNTVSSGGGTPPLTATQIAFGDGSGLMTSSADLIYNTGSEFKAIIGGVGFDAQGATSTSMGDKGNFVNGDYIDVNANASTAVYDNSAHTGKFGINTSTPSVALDISGVMKLSPTAFASLPGSPTAGMIAHISDSDTDTWGATISGSGALTVLAFYNGSNWTVIGK